MTTLFEKIKNDLFLFAGPCVIESESMALDLAESLNKLCEELGIVYVFKASFDKANRTSIESFRGPGLEEGLKVLEKIKNEIGIPVLTDIHEPYQAKPVGEIVDVLQIPAFLCRQTDLLVEAGKTGKIVNIKKAQFLSGKDMIHAVRKVESTDNKQIMLTERGGMFGYNNLVVDYRNIVDMKEFGYPTVMDVTHSTQKPGGAGNTSGGNREYAPYLAQAAAAVGVNGFFFEVHKNPEVALSDGPNMIKFSEFKEILKKIIAIRNAIN